MQRGVKTRDICVSKTTPTFSAALIVVAFFLLVPGGSTREEESTSFLPFVVVVVSVDDEVGRRPALLSRSSVIARSVMKRKSLP